MIKYSLQCDQGHGFEAWFSSSSDFDTQQKQGFVSCPHCNSTVVQKTLMAPQLSTSRQKDSRNEALRVAALSGAEQHMREKVKEVREHIMKNTTDVGDKFAEEARKIHYGEAEERGIRGAAKPDEVKSLVEEGVQLAPVPSLPEDAN